MYKFLPTKKTAKKVLAKLLSFQDLQKLKKNVQVVLCVGMPGSGKTTISELLAAAYGYWRFSSDQIRIEELFPGQEHRLASQHEQVMQARYAVYRELAKRTVKALKLGQKIVVDGTNLDDKREILLKALLKVIRPEKIALVILKTPKKIMEQRFAKEGRESAAKWLSVYRYWQDYLHNGKASYPVAKDYPGVNLVKIKRYDLETFAWILDIGVLVWDVDGTFYQDIPALHKNIEKSFINLVQKKLGAGLKQAEIEFNRIYKKLASKTKVLDYFGYNGRDEVKKISMKIDFKKYLKPDLRLRCLLKELSQFHHVILTNSSLGATKKKLAALGLSTRYFSELFCAYHLPYLKPDGQVFQYLIKQTSFSPHQHLYIGDREETDIVPARAAGMRTAMAWNQSETADVSFADVYGVGRLFGVEV